MKVPILLPNIFNHPFTYEDSSNLLSKGDFVVVPFGSSKITGIVWDHFEKTKKKFKIKKIERKMSIPKIKKPMIDFINWFSIYNMIPLGMCLRLILLQKTGIEKIKSEKLYFLKNNYNSKDYILNNEQIKCLKAMSKSNHGFSVHVLDGITGSGKTLVYFSRVKQILEKGLQALIMLPEIGLTTQFKTRFLDFFGFEPAIWHSDISLKNKKIYWRGVVENKIKVVVGARSSLFLPFQKLGIIIVDEEHDASYKQDEGVIYNARDMAITRASFQKIPIHLITSIPSIETYNNILNGKYKITKLEKRYQNALLPKFEIIDLNKKKIPNKSWIALETLEKVSNHLNKGNQVLFFINRRGFAPFVICKKCHLKFLCPNCSVNMNYHKVKNCLICHYCGSKSSLNRICYDKNKCDFLFCGPLS